MAHLNDYEGVVFSNAVYVIDDFNRRMRMQATL